MNISIIKMELVVEPDFYSPSIDEHGNYIDKIPSFNIIKKGLYCLCGARKDKVYETYSMFATHIKCKNHIKWLEKLNLNKANYYVENEELKIIVNNQKIIIAKLEKDIQTKIMTIDYLTHHCNQNQSNSKTVNNLLDFD